MITILPLTNYSQNSFLTTYPTTYDKDAREVLVTPDGGYLIAGSTNNSNLVDADLYVLKTDAQGNFQWGQTYGGAKPEYAYSMIETTDGNYFILGYSQSFGGGDFDTYLIKISPTGSLLWQKTYGGFGNDHGREIIKTTDGNYAFVGTTSSGFTSDQAFLTKIDLAGTVLWTKNYGGSMHEGGNTVKETSDGGFIIAGQTFSYGQGNGSAYLVKTHSNGDTSWTKYYNTGTIISEVNSLVVNSDRSFVFVVRDSSSTTDIDVRVMKTDSLGVLGFNKLYGGTKKDTPKKIQKTNDGGYVIASSSRSFTWMNPDMWILKLTVGGDTSWTKHFGGTNHEHGNDIKQTADGGYIAVGHAKSYGSDGQRIMLVKIPNSGTVGIKINDEELSFNLFPNPSRDGYLNIQFEKNTFSTVLISNSLGQIIYNQAIAFQNNETKVIGFGNNQPGMYLVTIKTDNSVITKKIIIE
jgi:hypothetical protein